MPCHILVLDDNVLEDFIESMSQMDVAVGIRRAVMKNVFIPLLVGLKDLFIDIFPPPPLYLSGLILRQVGPHGETSLR